MRSIISLNVTSATQRLLFMLVTLCAISIVACSGSNKSKTELMALQDESDDTLELTHPVTVSGVSAGAYMAVQTHVALSNRVAGIGVVAGGPYHCAAGSVGNALTRCLSGEGLDTQSLVAFAQEKSAAGDIADVSNLKNARVWAFHSPNDVVVKNRVAIALVEFYKNFVGAENIRVVDDFAAAHGWPTIDEGGDCLVLSDDFMNACDFDTAGRIMNHLYDDLAPKESALNGDVVQSIDLSDYFRAGSGVADTGYIFVPNDCVGRVAECRLHISFHGCRQGAEFVDKRFADHAGLNEWAANNQIVVVYPQIESSFMNPQGCWDWWGYSGSQYDQKNGKQLSGIDAIITAFANNEL